MKILLTLSLVFLLQGVMAQEATYSLKQNYWAVKWRATELIHYANPTVQIGVEKELAKMPLSCSLATH